MRKHSLVLSIVVVLALLLVSCAQRAPEQLPEAGTTSTPAGETSPTTAISPTMEVSPTTGVSPTVAVSPTEGMSPTVSASPVAGEENLQGQLVTVLAVWGGDELESFRAMVAPWEERTGARMEFEGTRDLNAVLTTRIQGGNPPDIAGLPGPGQLLEYARDGHLVDLSTFMDMAEMSRLYDQSWLDLASYEGKLYGLFMKVTVKSLVWYRPAVFQEAGYQVPETWDELIALSDRIAATGITPWSIGLESGAASGWPGTDWIEDIMLRTAGPEVYDQWRKHEIPWTDPAVKRAWETFGQIATNEQYVYGGTAGELATNFGEAPYPLFSNPPGAYLHKQASFITSFIQDQFPDLRPGEDYTFFPFPTIEAQYGVPALSAGDLIGMFNDTPAARSLMRWLASAEAQQIWAERGGFLAANKDVPASIYPDAITRQMAEILLNAQVVRFDASDLMPAAVNDAFLAGVLDYVRDPSSLDAILQRIEQVAQEAYQ